MEKSKNDYHVQNSDTSPSRVNCIEIWSLDIALVGDDRLKSTNLQIPMSRSILVFKAIYQQRGGCSRVLGMNAKLEYTTYR